MATIDEVSKLSQVSISTVSRVINNTVPVKDATRKRVFDAMDSLGYQPNIFAQGLVTNRSKSVALVLTNLTGAYFGPLVKSLENTLRKANYNLIISVENEGLTEVKETFRYLNSRRSDAVILFPHCLSEEQIIALSENSPPLVLLHRFIPSLARQSIEVDNEMGSRMAVEHLVRHGHTQIACITGDLRNTEAFDRLNGYRQMLAKHHIEYQDNLVYEGDFTVDSGSEGVRALLASGQVFTAVFACNDQMAAGAIKELKKAGKRVPEDVSIVGFDDVEFASLLTPALTTIKQPSDEMGVAAGELVLRLIRGESDLPDCELFAPTLVERDSVALLGST